jgi:DnaJ-class molecular chaperone
MTLISGPAVHLNADDFLAAPTAPHGGVSPNAMLPCDDCSGSGRARYTRDGELTKCRTCGGKGKRRLKKMLEFRLY